MSGDDARITTIPMKALDLPFRYRPWRPLHLRLVLDEFSPSRRQPVYAHRDHLAGAIDWLCRAQDVRDGRDDAGGVSAGWSFEDGWLPSYPETTGYIIETFFDAADLLDRPQLMQRARRMIDWEISLQQPDGAFPGHFGEPGSRPVIFNTGQIMHGMNAGFERLGRPDCLQVAVRAGHWLCAQQDDDGAFRRFEHNDIPHVYNTRGTWALAKTAVLAGDAALEAAARRHLDWALAQQTDSGWFAHNAFSADRPPFTHTIAYAIRGFLESGLLLADGRLVDAAIRAAGAVAARQRPDGWLAGTFEDGWVSKDTYCCLTGLAQMCICWSRLRDAAGEDRFGPHIDAGLDLLKSSQRLDDPAPEVRGGIAGSWPIWGAYSRFEFPNWAPKFFADALMLNWG
jgi:hypothetical protein